MKEGCLCFVSKKMAIEKNSYEIQKQLTECSQPLQKFHQEVSFISERSHEGMAQPRKERHAPQ